jgi:PII-like signaling protein
MTIPEEGFLLRISSARVIATATIRFMRQCLKAREQGMAGATVLRGVMGFGKHSVLHTAKILRLSEDLPMLIEIVDSREKVQGFLTQLDGMITDGLVTLEP